MMVLAYTFPNKFGIQRERNCPFALIDFDSARENKESEEKITKTGKREPPHASLL